MGSGRGGSFGKRKVALVPALAPVLALALGGCAGLDLETLLDERRAAMTRWSACVERHAARGDTSLQAIEATRDGCDGYRRDVARTFAPHLEPRVQTSLGARERRRVVRERAASAVDEPLSAADRLRERLDRLLLRTAAGREDG